MRFFIAQVLGFIALYLSCEAVFKKNKTMFFVYEALVDIFYAGSYIALEIWGAGVLSILSMFAMIILYFCQKYQYKLTFIILPISFVLYLLTGLLFWQSWLDIFPIIATILFTIGFYTKDLQLTRVCIAIPNLIFIAYNIIFQTYANALLDIIETVVVIWAIIKFKKERKLKKSILKALKRAT